MIPSSNAFYKLKHNLLEKMCLDIQLPKNIQLWTRNSFKEAAACISENIENSDVINDQLKGIYGTYISASTLERLMKYGYTLPNPIDKRRLNTLNKMCVYLGYTSWSSFCKAVDDSNSANEQFKHVIEAALSAEFEVYNDLPEQNLDKLLPYFIKDAPAYKQIYQIVNKQSQLQITLKNKNNPSYYQVLEIEVIKIEETEVHLTTHECWYLNWYNQKLEQPQKLYNENNKQLYILKKENELWKIYLNHYPFK